MTLKEYLASLGDTADEVAESLRKQGVKGLKRKSTQCPVVNGIYTGPCQDKVWPGLRIGAGFRREDGSWHYVATYNDDQIMDTELPQPVMNFIGEFDAGKYPDLEATKVTEKLVLSWE